VEIGEEDSTQSLDELPKSWQKILSVERRFKRFLAVKQTVPTAQRIRRTILPGLIALTALGCRSPLREVARRGMAREGSESFNFIELTD
jgi:hypothetical protein